MAAATQAFLSVASLGSALPTLSATKASSFSEFSGLASVRPIQLAYPNNSRRVALHTPLRIEAREPTRKETVKTRHRRICKKDSMLWIGQERVAKQAAN